MRVQTRERRLQDTAFAPSQTLQLPLPKDLVAKQLTLVFNGSLSYTFSSGSPAAPVESTFDTLINQIIVQVNGRVVKNVRPHMLHMVEILAFGQEGERKSSAGASAVTGNNPTADGGFAWGTTTQYTTARETVVIPFEMILAKKNGSGTWLDLRGKSQAEVKFITGPYSGLDTSGATITYANQSFVIEAYIEEVLGVPANFPLAHFKQTWSQESIGAQANERSFELNFGNFVAGLALYVKDGTAVPVRSDLGVTDIKIMTGSEIIAQTTFLAAQAKMRQMFGCNAARASNSSRLDGYVYIPLLTSEGDLNTAFDARALTSLRLVISTRSGVTYPLQLNIEQHEIVQVPA
ncbi:MAG: hypothetical protein NDJ89_09620 [Oligoflexia bacterium]|nr:hypothetical protein [Oligoflexia bacterium]